MPIRTIAAALAGASMLVSACTTPPRSSHEESGMIIGGMIGGVIGSQVGEGSERTTAIILGTMIGAAVGGAIGRSMDEEDKRKTGSILETVRTGVPGTWRNPDSGNQYTVVPTRTYERNGTPCRDYTVNALIKGRAEKDEATACRQADGSWRTIPQAVRPG